MNSEFFRRVESRNGEVQVWEWPKEGESYTIGADCSGGGARGDFTAGVVIANRDCRVVAILHEQEKPVPAGRKLARLAWTYNTAMLAIETFPSGYGTLACDAAMNYGYPHIYTQIDTRSIQRNITDKIGWRTDALTGDKMIGRVGQAITDRYAIPSSKLLSELWERRFDDPKKSTAQGRAYRAKIIGKGHDDLMDAYSIALLVRDELWTREVAVRETTKRLSGDERTWAWLAKREAARQGHFSPGRQRR